MILEKPPNFVVDGVLPPFRASQTIPAVALISCAVVVRGAISCAWLRGSGNFPACWACFLVYDDRVDVLAITGSKQRIDHSMSPDEARALWADLCQCGWHRASEEEITQHQMSHRKLRSSFTAVNLDRLEASLHWLHS
jgi:hypothetical protein